MPATVIYKFGYPSGATPVETSASVGSDGMVTGTALFVVGPTVPSYAINAAVSPSLFSALRGVRLQGLFVESRSLEKRNGLNYLRIGVVGAVNPPVFQTRRDVSPRSISKSQNFLVGSEDVTRVFSFDYHGETYSTSTVCVAGSAVAVPVPTPRSLGIWNRSGDGIILNTQEQGEEDSEPIIDIRIVVRPRILTTETSEERSRIVRIVKSAQFVFE
jgi:hypothetical protein